MDVGNCRAFVNGADQVRCCFSMFFVFPVLSPVVVAAQWCDIGWRPARVGFQGIVYTDLLGLEVFPAVCFYSSGRTISLVKVRRSAVVVAI